LFGDLAIPADFVSNYIAFLKAEEKFFFFKKKEDNEAASKVSVIHIQ